MSCCEREGLRASKRDRREVGSCNFCHRPHRKVFEMQGEHPSCTLVVRMCVKCVKELNQVTKYALRDRG